MGKVKVAILGTGFVAKNIAKAMLETPSAELYAISSLNRGEAEEMSKKFGIEKVYDTFDEVIADGEVSLVYIAIPHTFHYEWAEKALNAGKNVLCEKPMCVNEKEAADLFETAKEKNLFISEAMWTRFLPAVEIMQNLIKSEELGKPKLLTASLGGNMTGIKRMAEPELAGGMLLDSGIYALTTALLLFGEDISGITTKAVLSDKGVDLHSTTVLSYADGKQATLIMSMDSEIECNVTISCERGYITMDNMFNWDNIKVRSGSGVKTVEIPPQVAGGYEYETNAVCEAIVNGRTYCEKTAPERTLCTMKIMDAIRKQWGMVYPFEK